MKKFIINKIKTNCNAMDKFKVISGTPESVEATLNTINKTHVIDIKGTSSVIGITTVVVELTERH